MVLLLTQIGLFKTEGLDHVAPSCRRRQASSQKPNVCLKGETHAPSTKSHIRKMHQKQVVACTSVDMCDMCATRIPKVFRECASRDTRVLFGSLTKPRRLFCELHWHWAQDLILFCDLKNAKERILSQFLPESEQKPKAKNRHQQQNPQKTTTKAHI